MPSPPGRSDDGRSKAPTGWATWSPNNSSLTAKRCSTCRPSWPPGCGSTRPGTAARPTATMPSRSPAPRSTRVRYATVVVGGELDALKLLVEYRRQFVVARTRAACRLHRLLRELIAGGAPLDLSADHAAKLLAKVRPVDPAGRMRRQIAKHHIADIRALDRRLDDLAEQLEQAVTATGTSVTACTGSGGSAPRRSSPRPVTSPGSRPATTTPATPVPPPRRVQRRTSHRHRVNPAGNRQLNWAIHIAAIVQIRHDCPGRDYYRRKIAAGKDREPRCAA